MLIEEVGFSLGSWALSLKAVRNACFNTTGRDGARARVHGGLTGHQHSGVGLGPSHRTLTWWFLAACLLAMSLPVLF